jgi:hypothetical protein
MKQILSAMALLALVACDSEKVEVMKSPCVGLAESPCGPKRPVNEWWQHTVKDQA